MIPNILPPPPYTPQGWSPNALRPGGAGLGSGTAQTVFNGIGLTRSAKFSLSNADVLTLASVPINIQVAPGVGFILLPWFLYYHLDAHLGAWGTSRTIRVRFQAGGPTGVELIAPNLTIPNTAIETYGFEPIQVSVQFSSTLNNPLTVAQSPENWGLTLTASGDNTLGNAANFLRGVVWFMQVPITDQL